MRCRSILPALAVLLSWLAFHAPSLAAKSPSDFRDLNTPRDFPKITTEGQWRERAREIREQILVSSGLWPMPEKTPLHAVIFGKIVRDGYSIEKVYFQTYPGFYVAGNLYRPIGKGSGPYPAILNPHGHWENGRLADSNEGSIPGRCINFARQGMIAFSYDMVGYNDTHFPESQTNVPFYKVHRNFATNDPANLLWSVSLMGLQTWNSIRALDFLESLPDADPHRLACTGESGGGTQTFMLGAIDDRLAVQAPVVMVSHTMQGGCGCENMPGLRVEFSNMEIAAAAAPRPQILVGASGDWTKTMLTVEGPAIEHIYQLLNAPENLLYVRFDFPHNYNQTSREAVYQWFDKCLLSQPDLPVKELAFKKEPDQYLRVFPDGKLPPDALTEDGLIKYLVKTHKTKLRALEPKDKVSLAKYKQVIEPAWRRTLQIEWPDCRPDYAIAQLASKTDYTVQRVSIRADSKEHARTILRFIPAKTNTSPLPLLVVLAHSNGTKICVDESNSPTGLAWQLLDRHIEVAVVEDGPQAQHSDEHSILFNTYNRTRLQEEVRDLINICQAAKSIDAKHHRIVLCADGEAAFWSLLAAPATDCVIADCGQLDVSDDQNLLARGMFCPGIRNIDTFAGAIILAAPHPLLLHNLSPNFSTAGMCSTYKTLNSKGKLKTESHHLSDDQIAAWISQLK